MKQRKLLAAAVAAALGLGMSAAHADLLYNYYTGGSWLANWVDLGSNTSNNVTPPASQTFAVGTGFSVTLTLLGNNPNGERLLSAVTSNWTSNSAGSAVLAFAETGLAAPTGASQPFIGSLTGNSDIGVTSSQTMYYVAGSSTSLALKNDGTPSGTSYTQLATTGTNSGSGTPLGWLTPISDTVPGVTAPYTLMDVVSVSAGASGLHLGTTDTVDVPEPATLGLMGFALVGAGLARRQRKNKAA